MQIISYTIMPAARLASQITCGNALDDLLLEFAATRTAKPQERLIHFVIGKLKEVLDDPAYGARLVQSDATDDMQRALGAAAALIEAGNVVAAEPLSLLWGDLNDHIEKAIIAEVRGMVEHHVAMHL